MTDGQRNESKLLASLRRVVPGTRRRTAAGQDVDPRGLSVNETCFQLTSLLSQDEWFYPAADTMYWVSISAVYDIQSTTPAHPWGWTTRPTVTDSGAVVIQGATPSWPPTIGSLWLSGSQLTADSKTPYDTAFELLTNQGSAPGNLTLAPVYRFWSDQLSGHVYTIDEGEKEYLLTKLADVWTYEGIAFYAYAPGTQPANAKPVYRFWSDSLGHHFYTISDTERDILLDNPGIWAFEGIVWYAFD